MQAKYAPELAAALGVPWRWVALTGGCSAAEIKVPASKYLLAGKLLGQMFGTGEAVEPWHPNHTKGVPPLRFNTGQAEYPQHVNLVSMMQRADKRHALISIMH